MRQLICALIGHRFEACVTVHLFGEPRPWVVEETCRRCGTHRYADPCTCVDLYDPQDPPEMQSTGMLVDLHCPIHGARNVSLDADLERVRRLLDV